jgi:hypothetical protein
MKKAGASPPARLRLLTKAGTILLAGTLLFFGTEYLLLLLLGQTGSGHITNAVRRHGASRGELYTVYYEFTPPGGATREGSATTGASAPPRGSLKVRYLPLFPSVHHPGSPGLLAFYAFLCLVPGTLLFWGGTRLRHQ